MIKLARWKKRFIKFVDLIKNNTLNINQFIKGSFSYFKNPGSATIDGSFYKNNKLFSNNFMSEEFKFAVAEIHPGAPNLMASMTGSSAPG